jgi:hypothetical protein
MSKFKFDPANSPDQNVQRFFDHLKTHDPEMAEILLKNLSHINPLPDGAQRTAARKTFSKHVLTALQKLQAMKEGGGDL